MTMTVSGGPIEGKNLEIGSLKHLWKIADVTPTFEAAGISAIIPPAVSANQDLEPAAKLYFSNDTEVSDASVDTDMSMADRAKKARESAAELITAKSHTVKTLNDLLGLLNGKVHVTQLQMGATGAETAQGI